MLRVVVLIFHATYVRIAFSEFISKRFQDAGRNRRRFPAFRVFEVRLRNNDQWPIDCRIPDATKVPQFFAHYRRSTFDNILSSRLRIAFKLFLSAAGETAESLAIK